jgi:hypothetical protein
VSLIAFRKGADTVLLVRDGSRWVVNGFPASARRAAAFLSAAGDSSVRSEEIARSASSHVRLGLDSAGARRLTITLAGKAALDLWIGNRGPDFEGFYVRKVGGDVAYLLRGQFAELFAQGLTEWREKDFASVPAESIATVQVSQGRRTWSLARGAAGWTVGGKPADSTRVARFLAQFGALRAAGFPAPEEMDSISFRPPDRSVRLIGSDNRVLLALELDAASSGAFWVRGDSTGPIYRIDARVGGAITPAESTLRKP